MKFPRLKRLLRWTVRTLFVLLVLFIVFILEENIRGRIMLARYKAELRARGEKLTIEEFNFPKPVDSDAAQALFASSAELTNLGQAFVRGSLESNFRLKFIGPGCCVVRQLQPDPDIRVPPPSRAGRYQSDSYYVCTWGELAEKIAFARGPLSAADAIFRGPDSDFSIDYSLGRKAGVPQAKAVGTICAWSSAAALSDLHERNLDAATQDVLTIIDGVRFLRGAPLLQVLRIYYGERALEMAWEALQTPGWEDGQLSNLERALENASVLGEFESGVEVDRARTLGEWDREAHRPMRALLAWSEMSVNSWDDCSRFLLGGVWYVAWREQDEARGIRLWAKSVDAVRNSLKASKWTVASNEFKRVERDEWGIRWGFYNRWRYQMSVPDMPSGTTWGPDNLMYDVRRVLEYETWREMAVTAIALKRFELRHGQPPPNLITLVPDFLGRTPHGYMDGGDLRYHLNADGTWTLYSVGEDGVDNGGDPTIASPGLASRMWWGRDAVWPVAATPEEVEAWESLRMQRAQQSGPPRGWTQR